MLHLNDCKASLCLLYHHQHYWFCCLLSSFKYHLASSALRLLSPKPVHWSLILKAWAFRMLCRTNHHHGQYLESCDIARCELGSVTPLAPSIHIPWPREQLCGVAAVISEESLTDLLHRHRTDN